MYIPKPIIITYVYPKAYYQLLMYIPKPTIFTYVYPKA